MNHLLSKLLLGVPNLGPGQHCQRVTRVAFNSLWIFVYRWNMMIQDDIGCSMTMTINYDK